MNGRDSLSGYWLPLHGGFQPPRSVIEVETGGHLASLCAVAEGCADFAWIDCVTHALAGAHRPDALEGLRVVARTPPAPALPFVTALGTSGADLSALRRALREVVEQADYASLRETLLIGGFEVTSFSDYEYLVRVATGR